MPRSTSRGTRLNRYRPPDAVRVLCASCGRPFGYLARTSVSIDGDAVMWNGSAAATPAPPARPGEAPPPGVILDMIDHRRRRRRCVRQCGAEPVYNQATLLEKFQAATTAGQRTVRL
jgi:hypothetical protein